MRIHFIFFIITLVTFVSKTNSVGGLAGDRPSILVIPNSKTEFEPPTEAEEAKTTISTSPQEAKKVKTSFFIKAVLIRLVKCFKA
ncbi:uncharacterized protein PHALS_14640 [Plasmopara halstedii]|uniref:RxLR-like protein n=1 Tax=Plasmopara halstedii TaxID=4781 RepID=A0A0P1ANG6_PLAHL|nr:uncharacterized protein PHALS_14640 [Plasmopara halstedii]CEG42564.1 hypothetical protein PHALS_14640 [Plasmopara halstedii]|eukprot:XP_024578933.1 hypothetical protein PHALS_14640 [Plasmopara halstedii]